MLLKNKHVCCLILRYSTAVLCKYCKSLFLEMTMKQLQTLVFLQTIDVTISNGYDNPISLYAFKQTSDLPDNGNYGDSMNNCCVHDQQNGFNFIYMCMHLTAITGSASGGIVLLTAMVVTISL